MSTLALPADYTRIKAVASFQELVSTPFADGVNALCWQRTLAGDFDEVVQRLGGQDGVTDLDDSLLRSLELSPGGRAAVETLIADRGLLRELGVSPVLDCIRGYTRDDEDSIVATDVYSFHADRAPVATDTFLCSYTEPTTEALRNEDAQKRVDVPATRAELLKLFGGEDDDEFRDFLSEYCFDLHYCPVPQARPFSFGTGHLWRIAVDYPGSPVPPCIHRAPETSAGQPPRLLLIS
jgi:hypothetical protein